MAAFTFAHVKFFGSNFLLNYFLLGLMFPLRLQFFRSSFASAIWGCWTPIGRVVLPQVAFGLGMSILLFRNYFKNLPDELFQAAFVDGCGYLKFFWHISMPLSRPIIATVGIVSFVAGSWTATANPAAHHAQFRIQIPMAARHHGLSRRVRYRVAAGAGLHHHDDLPTIIVFFLAQKHIIAGLTAGAVKS